MIKLLFNNLDLYSDNFELSIFYQNPIHHLRDEESESKIGITNLDSEQSQG